MKFNTGDLVWLKSGSPPMTVRFHVDDVQTALMSGREIGVTVNWVDDNGVPHEEVYSDDQLKRNGRSR